MQNCFFCFAGGGSCCCCYESYFIIILFLIFLYKNNTFLSYNNLKCHSAISFVQSVQTNETSAKRAQRVTQAQVEKTGNKYVHRETRLFFHASRLARSHPRACPALTAACLKNVIDDAYPVGNLKSSSILCLNIIFHFISQVSHERPYLPQ